MRWRCARLRRGRGDRTFTGFAGWRFTRVTPDQLTAEQVRTFLLDLIQERRLSFSSFNQALNATRFFFLEVLRKPFVVEGLRFQRPSRTLPVVMSDEEVRRLLAAAVSCGIGRSWRRPTRRACGLEKWSTFC